MIIRDVVQLKLMPRPQFIHYTKDIIFTALERAGGTDEFAVITSLVIEDGTPLHHATLRRSLYMLRDIWPKNS